MKNGFMAALKQGSFEENMSGSDVRETEEASLLRRNVASSSTNGPHGLADRSLRAESAGISLRWEVLRDCLRCRDRSLPGDF